MILVDLPKGEWTKVLTSVTDMTFQIVNVDSKRATLRVWMSYGLVPPNDNYPNWVVEEIQLTEYFGISVPQATNLYVKAVNVDGRFVS